MKQALRRLLPGNIFSQKLGVISLWIVECANPRLDFLCDRTQVSALHVACDINAPGSGLSFDFIGHSTNGNVRNIPQSIYWAIVTITTVGYGDVAPVTLAGKLMACVIMLTGFAIIAVPTGVVTAELGREISRSRRLPIRCRECGWDDHDIRARCCQQCGTRLTP